MFLSVEDRDVKLALFYNIWSIKLLLLLFLVEEENLPVLSFVENLVEVGCVGFRNLSLDWVRNHERVLASENASVLQGPEANDCDLLCVILAVI